MTKHCHGKCADLTFNSRTKIYTVSVKEFISIQFPVQPNLNYLSPQITYQL